MSPRRSGPSRPLIAAGVAALAVLALGSATTRSTWTSGQLDNLTDTARTAGIGVTHTYPPAGGTSCAATAAAPTQACSGVLVSGRVPSAGLTATDAITNNGTATSGSLDQRVAATGCAPAQFADTKATSNPMVARYGVTFGASGPFSGTGGITLDGASPGGYATSVVAQTQPPTGVLSLGQVSGLGIWFNASAGQSGPLFSFGASAGNGTGSADRALYLNAGGQLSFVWNTSGSVIGPATKPDGKSLANGAWHFAYVTIGGVTLLASLIPQVELYVDGTRIASTPLVSGSSYTPYSGYWHVGYAPTGVTGLSAAYFPGSLSNFLVFNGTSFPPATSNPTSAAALSTFATNATGWWPLDDNGLTTYTGTLPVMGAGSGSTSAACKGIDLGWSFANPAGIATSSTTSLYSLATGGASAVAGPGAGATQTATLALSHDSAYDPYIAGLHLVVPMSSAIGTLPGDRWPLSFSWTPTATTTIIPAP